MGGCVGGGGLMGGMDRWVGGWAGGWHLVSKRDAQHVTLAPVEEVEVEVVEELGRVEDALGLRRDVPPVPLGRQASRAVVPVHGA